MSSVGEVQDVFDNIIRDGTRGSGESGMLVRRAGGIPDHQGRHPGDAAGGAALDRVGDVPAVPPVHHDPLPPAPVLGTDREECEIDQAYLCRLFRRFDREAPYRYLLRLKMNFAAEQLRDPKMLVKEAAASRGV